MKKSMLSYTKKIFFSLVFVMIISYIGFYVLLVIPATNTAQKEKHMGDIKKLASITSQQFNYLSAMLEDNAEWDTLYEILGNSSNNEKKQKFLNELFTEDSLELFSLDYIAIYDEKQNEVINYSVSEKNIKDVILSKGSKYFFSSQPNGENRVKLYSGYMRIDGKAYMFLSHLILNSNGLGKAAGYLLFMKEISDDYIFDLEIKNNLLLQLYIPGKADEELIEKILASRKSANYYSELDRDGKRVYYVPYMENVRKIAYVIKVLAEEKISKEILLSFIIGMVPIIIFILFDFFVKTMMDKKLVNPIMSLYEHIVSLKDNKEYRLLKYPKVGNEIDEVIDAFNSLMVEVKAQKTDIENKKINLEKLAYVDHLTGVATRRLMEEKYKLLFESAKRSETILTLIMIDLDYFKEYNDRYGHLKGDLALKKIGMLLKKVFKRDGDIVSRYGGDEFLVVLYKTSLKDTITLVEEFQKKLKICGIEHEDSPFAEVTVSMGIKSSKIYKNQRSSLFLREVDKALYKAKERGRNKYIFSNGRGNDDFFS